MRSSKKASTSSNGGFRRQSRRSIVKAGGQSGNAQHHGQSGICELGALQSRLSRQLSLAKDVWHIPEFFPLLTEQQEEFDKAITGQESAKQALDTVAAFQDKLLREAGRIK